MAKKFIEFLEAAALIILTGVIVVGVMKYIDTKEEPKEETPVVDVEQVETEFTLNIDWDNTEESNIYRDSMSSLTQNLIIPINYTWVDFINDSVLNADGMFSIDVDGTVCLSGPGPVWYICNSDTLEKCKSNEVINGGSYILVLEQI